MDSNEGWQKPLVSSVGRAPWRPRVLQVRLLHQKRAIHPFTTVQTVSKTACGGWTIAEAELVEKVLISDSIGLMPCSARIQFLATRGRKEQAGIS